MLKNLDFRSTSIIWDSNGVAGYFWPLNRLESKAIYEDLALQIIDLGKTGFFKQYPHLLIVILNFLSLANSILLAEKLVAAIREKGSAPLFPEGRPIWTAAYERGFKDLAFSFTGNLEKGLLQPSPLRRALRPLKDILHPISGFKRSHTGIFNPETDIACTTLCTLTKKMVERETRKVCLLSLSDWFYPLQRHEIFQSIEIQKDAWERLERIIALTAEKFSVPLSMDAVAYIRKWVNFNLSWVAFYDARIRRKKIPVPKTLWVSSQGNVFNRMLAQFVLARGGTVQTHDHAEGGNFSQDLIVPFKELALTSRFITFTRHQAEEYRKNALATCFELPPPDIDGIKEHDLIFSCPASAPALRGKRIVYPCPMLGTDLISAFPLPHAVEYIDWQSRLFNILGNAGFEVWFKPHPSGASKFPAYSRFFKNVVTRTESFEEVCAQSDQVLFDWTLTTTFGNAFLFDKPITIVDFGIARYSEPEMQALKKRCKIIPGWFDRQNRMQTDEEKLILALKGSL